MELLAALGGGSFILASLIVGGRLLLLWRQTRALPELCMGMGLFLMGGVGYPLMIAAQLATTLPDGLRASLVGANLLCNTIGHCCLAIFTWRVFRSEARWALGLMIAIASALVLGTAYQALVRTLLAVANGQPIWPWLLLVGVANLLWAGVESFVYLSAMRRRAKLGLADPVLVDRMRLWAVAITSAAITAAVAVAFESRGVNIAASALGVALIAPLGLITAGALWLAFLPPRRYTRWIAARAG